MQISSLTPVGASAGTDQFAVDDGKNTTKKATLSQILTFMNANLNAASATQSGFVTTGAQTFAGDKTFNGNVYIDGFQPDSYYLSMRAGFAPTASGGVGLANIDPDSDGNYDGLGVYGHDSIGLYVGQTKRVMALSTGTYFYDGAGGQVGSVDASGNMSANGTGTFSGGSLTLNNGTSNALLFTDNGIAPPSTSTRSAGAKLALWVGTSGADYSFGIDSNTLWASVPTGAGYKWYVNGVANLAHDSTGTKIGPSPTAITNIATYSPSLTPVAVPAQSASDQAFTVAGLATNDKVIVNPPDQTQASLIMGRVTAANTITLTFTNPTAGSVTPAAGTYEIVAIRS